MSVLGKYWSSSARKSARKPFQEPIDTYTQTKTTWNNSDWLVHKKATFYWSRFDTQMLTGLVNRSGKVGKMKS